MQIPPPPAPAHPRLHTRDFVLRPLADIVTIDGGRSILNGGRIAADGSSFDGIWFPILDTIGAATPALPSDGADFFVITWVKDQLLGSRVSAAGEVLDPEGILIAIGAKP